MDDHDPMAPLVGVRRHHFETTELELHRVGTPFHRVFCALLAQGEDPNLVLAAMSYALGAQYALMSCVPSLDLPLSEALPTFAVGYRTGTRSRGH